MSLNTYVSFDPIYETQDSKGWVLQWWDSGDSTNVTTERFHRLTNGSATSWSITNKALTSNVATITTSVAHGLTVGTWVTVALTSADPVFDGTYKITAVTSTTFSYARTNANVGSGATTGTASLPQSLTERLKALFSADTTLRSYFLDQATDAYAAANVSTINSNRDALLVVEGLTP